jgi:hypothetical protein
MHRRRFVAARAVVAAGSVALVSLGLVAGPASAGVPSPGAAPLTIVKTVSGPVPAGTTFTASIVCDDTIIEGDGGSTDAATVEFDATGQPTTPDTVTFDDPGTCTVTETATGGAATTTYACEGVEPVQEPIKESDVSAAQVEEPICPTAGPQAAPISVNIEFEDQTATVTIHNTFNEPTPQVAPQVVAQPAFTG